MSSKGVHIEGPLVLARTHLHNESVNEEFSTQRTLLKEDEQLFLLVNV